MAWLYSSHLTLDRTADQGEVADDIEQLVTGGFIVEIQLDIVQDATFFHRYFRFLEESGNMVKLFGRNIAVDEHDSIGQITAFDEVTADERLQFMKENKGTARSNLVFKVLEVMQGCMLLVKHSRVILDFNIDFKPVARLNAQFNAQDLVLVGNRLFDDQIVAISVLLDDASFVNGFNKMLCTAIHDRCFFHVNVNQHIIDTHTTQGSQDMLHSVNLNTAFAEGSTTGCIDNIVNIGFDDGLVFQVNSTKTYS